VPPWRIWIDTGGTFTDGLAVTPDGDVARAKVLSSGALRGIALRRCSPTTLEVHENWQAAEGLLRGLQFRFLGETGGGPAVARYDRGSRTLELSGQVADIARLPAPFEIVTDEESPLFVARILTGTPRDRPLPPCRMRVATTLGTNALLQRAGVPTALFITRGLGDLLEIGTQQRPDLFRLDVRRPRPLYETVVEVSERLGADGTILEPIRTADLKEEARRLLDRGVDVAAVALMHSYRDSRHELELKRCLLEWGFRHVSCSSELAPRIKLLHRAETAVVDAYLAPLLRTFVEHVESRLGDDGNMLMMTSAGGLLGPGEFRPKDGLLSGPAGGVVGSALAGGRSGFERVISFDMGGTSTDVARFDGEYDYRYEHQVGDARLAAPALAIETVAAGGGSICWLDGERLRVGPRSAGAQPGPACYAAGGPLTLTDVNLLLGRLDPDRFQIPVDIEPAKLRFEELRAELDRTTGTPHEAEPLLAGFVDIANEIMADAMRRVSLRRGYDPVDHALVAFGGAGGQHACAVADLLGVRRLLVPADAALLSALGLGHAVVERFEERQVLEPLEAVEGDLASRFEPLAEAAARSVARAGIPAEEIVVRRRILHLRYAGQDSTIEVDYETGASIEERFSERYQELYGHRPEHRSVEVESIRVVASSIVGADEDAARLADPTEAPAAGKRTAWFAGGWIEVATHQRECLGPGDRIAGPAVVLEPHSATVVEPGWSVTVDARHALVLERRESREARTDSVRPEAVRLELYTQRFTSLVGEMGERLERTAISTNVKERLDFSCALLDPAGELVVNAPHIPVHLGAIGLCVRSLKESLPLEPGDVAVTNHPAFGGSHLPDVTVVTPVFEKGDHGGDLIGYVANRAHHAEIGGARPGSMPPTATCLAEEGVVIPPSYLVRGGVPRWEETRRRLEQADYPTRNVEDNLADLRAAVAANHAGSESLRKLVAAHGVETILRYMKRLGRLASDRIHEALARFGDGRYEAVEHLDDGTPIRVAIDLKGGRGRLDFSGSGQVHPGNLNATPAIVQSAVIYVLRLLLREPLPLNEGLLQAVTICLPPGLLNPDFPDDPRKAPAVVGGNVETSQRLVDTLLRALELAACSQGTMNNLIFGNERFGYYETLGGGVGAGSGFDGASAVHSHMTNTRITDPEILEQRYPVRVERFAIRRGSGGEGRFRGGDGLIRDLRFLEPVTLSILSQHRTVAPYGLRGGNDGSPGRQQVVRASGAVDRLGPIDGCELAAGDRIIVETPGGGGWGRPQSAPTGDGAFRAVGGNGAGGADRRDRPAGLLAVAHEDLVDRNPVAPGQHLA